MNGFRKIRLKGQKNLRSLAFDLRSNKKAFLYLLEGFLVLLVIAEVFYSSILAVIFLSPLLIPIYRRRKRSTEEKRQQELVLEFKECMNSILTALKAGYSCENAFREATGEMEFLYGSRSEIGKELSLIAGGLDNNIPLEKLLMQFAERSHSEEIQDFAEVFAVARRSGGDMAEILRRTISQIQDRIDVEREIQILVSSKRLEQLIMDIVPFGIIAYIGVSAHGFFDVMYHNTAGILVMTVCLVIYGAAFWLSEKIIAIEV